MQHDGQAFWVFPERFTSFGKSSANFDFLVHLIEVLKGNEEIDRKMIEILSTMK